MLLITESVLSLTLSPKYINTGSNVSSNIYTKNKCAFKLSIKLNTVYLQRRTQFSGTHKVVPMLYKTALKYKVWMRYFSFIFLIYDFIYM